MAYTKKDRVLVEHLLNRVVSVAAGVKAQYLEERNQADGVGRKDWLDAKASGADTVMQKLIAFRDWELK